MGNRQIRNKEPSNAPNNEKCKTTKKPIKMKADAVDAAVDRMRKFHLLNHRHRTNTPVRLENIFAKPLQISPGYEPPVFSKSEDEKCFILRFTRDAAIFSGLDDDELNVMANAMEMFKVPAGTTIITQGDVGDYFYLIEEGTVQFWVDEKMVGDAGPGYHFGDLALLYNCPRGATCIAHQDCELWRIDQGSFRKILAVRSFQEEDKKLETLRNVDFLEDISEDDLLRFADVLKEVHYNEGDIIVKKGQDIKEFFIISKGNVIVTNLSMNKSRYIDQELGPGEYFGDSAIFKQHAAIGNVVATSDCNMLCMSNKHFLKMFGGYQELILTKRHRYRLLAVPLIAKANFSSQDIDRLSSLLIPATYQKDEVIVKLAQGYQPTVFFILSGKVSILRNRQTKILGMNEYFGEDSFLKGKFFLSQCTVKALEETRCVLLTLNSVQLVLRGASKLISGQQVDLLPDPELTLENVTKHRLLGTGTFGDVWLITDDRESESTTYALKIQNKRKIIKLDQQDNVIEEKNINTKLHHPFIQTLVNAFQDESCLYLVMKLYQGGELFNAIDRKNGLPNWKAKFYAACILEAINYMHHRHVIHRDLKPENVLFDSDGYCVLVDLGFSKVVMNKTYTMCGTPLYMAPEVILQRGYNKSADIWSLGIMIFELLEGKTPFYRKGIEQADLLQNIVKGKYEFTKTLNVDAMDLVSQLLLLRPADRLGCLAGGDASIRKQVWFQSIDFKKLQEKKLPAPWVPTIKDPLDCTNFDDWGKSTESYEDEKPLSPMEQKFFTDFDATF